jgi:DNA-binding response OmpR family regulator
MVLAWCGSEQREDFGVEVNVKSKRNSLLRLDAGTSLTNPNLGGLHILIVDDDRDIAESMAILVWDQGHRVQIASDGPSACLAALRNPPDVVLLDLVLPGMDGWEVARRFQDAKWVKKPFLIAFTSYDREEERSRSLESGIDLHLVKPVDPDFLRRVLERFQQVILPATTEHYEDIDLEPSWSSNEKARKAHA